MAATGAFVAERNLKLVGLFGPVQSAAQRRLAILTDGASVILIGALILPSLQAAADQWESRTAILSVPLSVWSASLLSVFCSMFLIGAARFAVRYSLSGPRRAPSISTDPHRAGQGRQGGLCDADMCYAVTPRCLRTTAI